MTRRDWVATGAAFGFGGVGFLCWTTATGPGAGVLTLLGTVPLCMGMAALFELTRGR